MTEKKYEGQEFTVRPLGGDRWTLRMMTPRGTAGLGVFKSPDEAKDYAVEIGGVVIDD